MLIINGTIVTWQRPNQLLEGQSIYIEDGKIQSISTEADIRKNVKDVGEVVDAIGQLIMPGLICAHTHFYGAFARGMNIPGEAPKDFPEILNKLWWRLDKVLTENDVLSSTYVCLIDAIRSGCTTLIDHHASPNSIDGSLDVIAQAVEHSGLRASLCYEVTDRDGSDKAKEGIEENVRFIKKVKRDNCNGRLSASFGMHASLTISEQTLEACKQAIPADTGFHLHVAEHPIDQYDSIRKSGSRVVDRLFQNGVLGPKTIIAHAVHVDAREVNLLAETKTWVTHQPRSNMNNAVGIAEIESMMRAGVRVGMGNDGFTNAMWEEWKAAYLSHKLWHLDPRRMNGMTVVEMGVYQNAALVNHLFNGVTVGILEPGAAADIILVDYDAYTPVSADNIPWHILFGFCNGMVTTTIVAGKVLMKDREILGLDTKGIISKAREQAVQAWKRYEDA